MTVNVFVLEVPPTVTTETFTAPAPKLPGTVTWICVSVLLVSEVTTVELNFTSVALARLEPVMVNAVPVGPEIGEIEAMNGARITVKLVELLAVPFALITDINPVVAATGTVAVICVVLFTINEAAVLLNLTAVTALNNVPVMVTDVPTGP